MIQPSSRTTVRLPEVLHQRAKMAAAWSGVKLQDFVARAVEEHLIHVESAMDRSPRQWR
ncbi:MAG: toxin-antitoxin system HicB family antitoxin [Acidobacteriota bacterium]